MLTHILLHVLAGIGPVDQVVATEHADGVVLQHACPAVTRTIKVCRHDIITVPQSILGQESVAAPRQVRADAVNDSLPAIQFIEHQPQVFLLAQGVSDGLRHQSSRSRLRHQVRHVAIQIAVRPVIRSHHHVQRLVVQRIAVAFVHDRPLQRTDLMGLRRTRGHREHGIFKSDLPERRVIVHGMERPFHLAISALQRQFHPLVQVTHGLCQIQILTVRRQHTLRVQHDFLRPGASLMQCRHLFGRQCPVVDPEIVHHRVPHIGIAAKRRTSQIVVLQACPEGRGLQCDGGRSRLHPVYIISTRRAFLHEGHRVPRIHRQALSGTHARGRPILDFIIPTVVACGIDQPDIGVGTVSQPVGPAETAQCVVRLDAKVDGNRVITGQGCHHFRADSSTQKGIPITSPRI